MFENISMAPLDPILGVNDILKKDLRNNKIDLSIGVYKDRNGNTPVLSSVKKAELLLLKKENSKNYLSIEGNIDFNICTQRLLFGSSSNYLFNRQVCSIQTPGGTSALRIAAEFLVQNTSIRRIWISDPSWLNYQNIFYSAGLKIKFYNYYNYNIHNIDFGSMVLSLKEAKVGDAVLLQGCCHNPTGTDLKKKQWYELSNLSYTNGWLPFFDFAYQGLANGINEDVVGLRIFCKNNRELIVCNSYSKNFSLYSERVGSCTLVSSNEIIAKKIFSRLKNIVRYNYSNPPSHGAAIVTTILNNKELSKVWKLELKEMRKRIKNMRNLLVHTLINYGLKKKDFNFINYQNGMFFLSGLNKEQVLKMRERFAIYMLESGRINILGINKNNVKQFSNAFSKILKNS